MNLEKDLEKSKISVSKIQEGEILAEFQFSKNLALFTGHFPDKPILPGIVQVEMVKYTLEKALGIPLAISSMEKTKFARLIQPETRIKVAISLTRNKEDKGHITARALLKTSGELAGKVNIKLTQKQ